MYQDVYVQDWYRVWYHKYGDVIENKTSKERYLIIESTIEDILNGE